MNRPATLSSDILRRSLVTGLALVGNHGHFTDSPVNPAMMTNLLSITAVQDRTGL